VYVCVLCASKPSNISSFKWCSDKQIVCKEYFVKQLSNSFLLSRPQIILMDNSKRILISLIRYRFVVSLIMVLMNVIVHDIIHGITSIIKIKIFTIKICVSCYW